MNTKALAAAVVDAGAVRGKEVANGRVFSASWLPDTDRTASPTKLLSTMSRFPIGIPCPTRATSSTLTAATDGAIRALPAGVLRGAAQPALSNIRSGCADADADACRLGTPSR